MRLLKYMSKKIAGTFPLANLEIPRLVVTTELEEIFEKSHFSSNFEKMGNYNKYTEKKENIS